MKKSSFVIQLFVMAVILMLAFTASCDKRNPPVVIPPQPEPPLASQLRIITKMVATQDTIYADNNITFSLISVTVKDGDGFAVPNQIVNFKTDIGRLITNVATDSSGVATTTFWDDGEIGEATVLALVKNYAAESDSIVSQDSKTLNITIVDVPPIQEIILELPTNLDPQPMTVMQSMTVRARAKNILGNDVPDNTLISFSASRGYFVDVEGNLLGDSIVVQTVNGRATASYNSGPLTGSGMITARLSNQASSRNIQINPDHPFAIALYSYVGQLPNIEPADSSFVGDTTPIWMRAYLRDKYNNVCPSKPVKFTTNLGTFTNTNQTTNANTNSDGFAQVRFTPGLAAGAATISAFANNDTLTTQIIFNVMSDDIHSISFTQAGQIDLNVANTGGVSSAVLRVKLKDINDNLVDTPQNVYFKIMNSVPPAGANLNNEPVQDSVLVTSSGGEAMISVNSGSVPGVLSIRASTTKNGRYVTATKSNIVIHGGPPYSVVPFISGFNSGTPIGGGIWRVVAGAVVTDVYGNPVQRGNAVWFRLPDDTYNCQVGANSYVGNTSVTGDSIAGVAYTTLSYSGYYTFEELTLRAETYSGTNIVWGQSMVILPLNEPQMEAQVVPGHLSFGNTAPNFMEATVLVSLVDGQGCEIHGAQILLSSNRGFFVYTPGHDPILYPNPPATPYLIISATDGIAEGKFRLYRVEIPLPDPQTETPGQISVEILARILGTNTIAQTTLVGYRYINPPG